MDGSGGIMGESRESTTQVVKHRRTFTASRTGLYSFTLTIGPYPNVVGSGTFRAIVLGTDSGGQPLESPIIWQSSIQAVPDVTTEFTFFPDVDLVVGEQYYVGMDNGLFTDASGTLEISINQDVIPDGLYWTRINGEQTWNDYGGVVDIASRIEMRCVAEPVPVDIKPGSCPNPLNVKSRGVLPVAILGTSDLDVTTIDPASIRLHGVAPLRSGFEDVATPFDDSTENGDCLDCTTDGPDGFIDLTLKFDSQELVTTLGEVTGGECLVTTFGEVTDGECLELELTGNLDEEFGGAPIEGRDVVVIKKKGRR